MQDAYAQALTTWADRGIPAQARRLADDGRPPAGARRAPPRATLRRKLPAAASMTTSTARSAQPAASIADDRLRLIFTCCHPALRARGPGRADAAAAVRALTTAEVARAFLVSEPTMAARITRAKKKIAVGPHPVPRPVRPPSCPAGSTPCSRVVHLLFTTGHTAPAGAELRRHDLVERAARPGPDAARPAARRPDVAGLLALILLTDARRATRVGCRRPAGAARRPGPLPLGSPPRSPRALALAARGAGAPAARPVRAAGGDRRRPRRGAELGRHRLGRDRRPLRPAVPHLAVAGGGAQPGRRRRLRRRARQPGSPRSTRWAASRSSRPTRYLPAARADFLRRLGRRADAASAYEEALLLTSNEVERRYLAGRLDEVARTPRPGRPCR